MKYDLVVVGGRVSGSISALEASKRGLKVLMIEKNPEIGTPVQCAGGVSDSFFESVDMEPSPAFTCTKINGARIHSPSGASIITRNELVKGYIIERKIFDKHLAIKAAESGADIMLNTMVSDLIINDGSVSGVVIKNSEGLHEIKSEMVIAADGIQSQVARKAGIKTRFRPMEVCSCAQFEVVGAEVDDEVIELHFGNKIAPGGYLWVFPKGEGRANIGAGIRRENPSEKSALHYLNKFISSLECRTIEFNAGAVPVGGPIRRTYGDGILVVGDAAGQVDPLTGGGIHIAARCARIAGEVAAEAIENNRKDRKFLSKYENIWRSEIGHNLERSLKYRKILDRLTDKELEGLIKLFGGKDSNSISKLSLLKALREYPTILKILKELL